jgi:hypothetical protein
VNVSRSVLTLAGCLVLILVCSVVFFGLLPPAPAAPAPAGTVVPSGNTDPSRTCPVPVQDSPYNLEQANGEYLAVPTVVDINVENGNLLMRGPLPLILRNGTGNCPATSPSLNQSEWRFAYDELNGFVRNASAPAYFSDAERNRLGTDFGAFDLADYEVIDVSLLSAGGEMPDLGAEERAFGGNFSTCTGPLDAGTLHGRRGYMIWSPLAFPMTCMNASCASPLIYTNNSYPDFGPSCSLMNLVSQLETLLKEKSPSGKKRLIYYHCTLGRDRTGAVTMSYILNRYPEISYCHALQYAENLGGTTRPPQYYHRATTPLPQTQNLALAYCNAIRGGTCSTCPKEERSLPGVTGVSVL